MPYQKVINVPEIKKIKKSIMVPRYVDKEVVVVREVEVPVNRTIIKEIEKPVYVDKVVQVPV